MTSGSTHAIRPARLIGAGALLAVALAPTSAHGASQTITVTNPAVYAPAAVTIDVGESVTWRWTNGLFPPHTVTANPGQAEAFDSGSQQDGYVFTYTFTHVGAFRFYCKVHSTPDGTIQNGVVTVVDPPPTASFVTTPTAPAGAPARFDASASSDAQGPIARYEWDLDGDGTFETDTGTSPTVSHVYPTTGAVSVGLRVTDGGGNVAATSRSITVDTGGLGPAPVGATNDTVPPALSGAFPLPIRGRTALSFRLSEAATLAGRLERALPRARGERPRFALVRSLPARRLAPGRRRLDLGRLPKARYRVRLTLADARGNRRAVTFRFGVR